MKVTIYISDPAEDIQLAAEEVSRDLKLRQERYPDLMSQGKITGKLAYERVRLEEITERVMHQLADNMRAMDGWNEEEEDNEQHD